MLILKYFRERFSPQIFIPVVILLGVGCEKAADLFGEDVVIIERIVVLLPFVFCFRLWDDLGSRKEDALLAPDRITVDKNHAETLHKWLWAFFALSILCLVWFFALTRLVVASVLMLFYFILYAARKRLTPLSFTRANMVKYPSLAFIVSSEGVSFLNKLLPLTMIYLVTVIYEVFHDKKHRGSKQFVRTGFIAWGALSVVYILYLLLSRNNGQIHITKWVLLSISISLFVLLATFKKLRDLRIVLLSNGFIYIGIASL